MYSFSICLQNQYKKIPTNQSSSDMISIIMWPGDARCNGLYTSWRGGGGGGGYPNSALNSSLQY